MVIADYVMPQFSGLAALAIYKHKANIERLINGTENRMALKRPAPSDAPKPTV